MHAHVMGRSSRALFLAVSLCALAALSSCSVFRTAPDDARAALLDYWDSLPSDPGVEHRINRVWAGDVTAHDPELGAPPIEVWCVEAEMSSPDDPTLDDVPAIWFVTRQAGEGRWSVSLLAAMSSTWPYEACEEPG